MERSAELLFGYPEEEAIGKPISLLMPPDLAELHMGKLGDSVSRGVPSVVGKIVEGRGKKKDNTEFPIELSLSSWQIDNETFFTGILRDISERKKGEEKLQLFSKALDEASEGVQVVALDGTIIYSNKAVEEIFGFSNDELVGTSVNNLSADPHFAGREIFPVLQEKGRWNGEVVVRRKQSGNFPIWLSASMVRNNRGKPIAIIGIIRDITESKNAEQELRRHRLHLEDLVTERTAELQTAILCLTDEINTRKNAEARIRENEAKIRHMHGMKLIGEMASAVAHEVRNPLHALMSVTEALKQELQDNREVDIYIHHINDQVQRLSSLMKDLLDLGKPIEPSNLRYESLSEICGAAVALWKHMPLGQRRTVELDIPEVRPGALVLGDGQRLQQVFLNLLDNAAHHSPENSPIRVAVRDLPDGSAQVLVIDEGSGIQPELMTRIFDPFFSTRRGGTGLGLNIVKNIIESHGGTLSLANNSPLPGCTAELILPISNPRDADGSEYSFS